MVSTGVARMVWRWLLQAALLVLSALVVASQVALTPGNKDIGAEMIAATLKGDQQELIRLMNLYGAANYATNPLLTAIRTNNTAIARLLLDRGADVNLGAADDIPIIEAIKTNNWDMVDALLQKNPNLNVHDIRTGLTPLLATIERNDTTLVRDLVQHGASVGYRGRSGDLPLIEAIKVGNREIVELLVAERANLDDIDFRSSTPLLAAIGTSNVQVLELLLDAGADVNIIRLGGVKTPLVAAIRTNNIALVTPILERGASVNVTEGDSPLTEAVKVNNLEIVEAVLLRCPDTSLVDTTSGRTAAQEASFLDYDPIAAAINDKLAECTRCPDRCVRCPAGTLDYADRYGLETGQHSVDSGVVGDTRQLPCPASGFITWTCSDSGSWVNSDSSICLVVFTTSTELTTDSSPFPTDSSELSTSNDPFSLDTSPFPTDTNPSPSDTVTAVTDTSSSSVDPNTFTSTSTNLTTPDNSSDSTASPASSFTPNIGITTDDVNTSSINPGITPTTSSVTDSWCQTTDDANEGIPMCQRDVENIIDILNSLKTKFNKDLQDPEVDTEKIAKEYMLRVMAVLDRSEPHRWRGVEASTRAVASTILQESITAASLALASLLSNYTTNYRSNTSDSSIMRQSPSYFTALKRRHQHHSFNRTSIELPVNFHRNYIDDDGLVTVLFHSFDNLHCATNSVPCDPAKANISELWAESQINSPIIGATVKNNFLWKSPERDVARLKLEHIYLGDRYKLGSATCVWWNTSTHGWSSVGCWLQEQTDHYTLCLCDHLTNLAVMMDIYGVIDVHLHVYLRWITVIGCSVSIICLSLCVLCLSMALTSAKKHSGQRMSKIHIHLCVCLGAAELVMLSGLDATHNPVVCKVVAALLHYLFLATFTWCAIEGLNLYFMLGKVFATFNPLKYYVAVGYGFPLLFVGVTLSVTHTQGYGTVKACWLEPGTLMWTFAGPVLVIMTVNMVSFAFALKVACRRQTQGASAGQRPPVKMRGSLALFLILGLTWTSGFFYVVKETQVLAFVFTVLNSLQGMCIFVTTVVMNERLLKDLGSVRFIRRFHNTVRGRKREAQGAHQDSRQHDENCTVELEHK